MSESRVVGSVLVIAALVAFAGGCSSVPPLPPRALELQRDGAAALAAGDLGTAEARLSVALEYSPRFTEAWVDLGYVELRRGNLDRARKYFVKARGLNPDLAAPHHALALLADQRGLGKEAEAHYRAALAVDPGFAASRANLARRLFGRGAVEEARTQFHALVEVQPAVLEGHLGLAECLLRLEREPEADEVLTRARRLFGDAPELRLLLARQLLRREAWDEAEDALAPLTGERDRPRAASAWAWIGVARLARGDVEGARSAARQARAIAPEHDVAREVFVRTGAAR